MLAAERVKVFWQPGCTSCLRTKEFLTKSGVEYESINVHGNPAGMEELRKLGARSVPVVARGDQFVFAQAIGDVIKFLDLKVQMQERLSPDELVKKLELVLPAACRYVRQIPAEWLDKPFRNRNRPIRVLCHHVFRIVEGFLESMQDGRELTYERIMQEAPALRSGEDIASLPPSDFSTNINCCLSGIPVGITILPPGLSCASSGGGIKSGAAVTTILSKGACSLHP